MNLCDDCKEDNLELTTCDVCGRKVCALCFAEYHDGVFLPLSLAEAVKNL